MIQTVDRPSFEAAEAIGGTGDTLTGMISVLCGADARRIDAAMPAAGANRWSGYYGDHSPATQVTELIETISQALVTVLNEHKLRSSNVGW